MTKNFERHTITAALPYANGPVHIGHLAGVYVPADIYARYLRLQHKDVMFVCGSDEHGVPVTIRAKEEGVTVQAIVDKYHTIIKESFEAFGMSFDIYARTSNATHHQTASDFFKKLYEEGKFIEKTAEQYYDPEAQQFLADRYIQGTCPNCGNPEAYGDQCERCGTSLSPDDLGNPRSMLSGASPIRKATKHWYLPLNDYEDWLSTWILEGHKKDWKTNVYGQCKSWIEQGLQPRAVTRDLDWGVPVPVEEAAGKVLYVWFDAPIGYISATKDYFKQQGKDEAAWQPYWQDEQTKLVHFIGKDNIVFHCIIFPAMLKAHGDFILPENVPANEFLNLEGRKISTSRNWAVWLHEYLEDFPDKQDVLRYVLTANAPEAKDNDFTWADFQARNNNELVANVGNFVNRVLTLTHKYFEGKVPRLHTNFLEATDKGLIEGLSAYPKKISASIEAYRFKEALGYIMELSSTGNKYLQEKAPWLLAKDFEKNRAQIENTLHLALQVVANFTILAQPFLPFTTEKLKKALALEKSSWQEAGKTDLLAVDQPIEKTGLLFEKIEDKTIQVQQERLAAIRTAQEAAKTTNEASQNIPTIKDMIEFNDFMKLDLRVATILQAEKMSNSDKLLKITLDTGVDQRIVLSGIAKHYQPEEIVGKQVCIVANLKPKKMAGEVSQGMILMAEDSDGKLQFIQPGDLVHNGSTIS
ncbi:MAG: methionine--tRNA ligase [Thermonemataceae bacterium]